MKTKRDIKDRLKAFIEKIDIKLIQLNNLEFKLKDVESKEEGDIYADLSITPKLKEEGKIHFFYTYIEKITVDEKEIDLKIVYTLIVEYNGDVKELKRDLLMAYAKNSGLLVVYPYIRHTSDILKREAGFIFPPLPHVLIE